MNSSKAISLFCNVVFLWLFICRPATADVRSRIDLLGNWDFYADVGSASAQSVTAKPTSIKVPGAWQAQGYGSPGGTIPSANIGPGTSPAEYLRHNLMARCLYVRAVPVPKEWEGNRVFLCVRRAYRYTDVTVNGRRIGEHEGFCSPFEFDITGAVRFGQMNQLALGVDNRPRPGLDTLGTANLYGNWGGLGGGVYLECRPTIWIEDVFAIPQLAASRVVLRVTVQSASGPIPALALEASITARPSPGEGKTKAAVLASAQTNFPAPTQSPLTGDLPVEVPNARLWTPADPFLYVATVRLHMGNERTDQFQVRFGMREITAAGNKLFLNGKPLYLSGYGDDATEPITGMLPADPSIYRSRLALMRSLGFNFVRHHSCVPHDEYLDAADEAGMLVQPEAGLAYTGFWRTGHGLFEREWPEIVRAFRNHPCIWAWCMGNELFLNEIKDSPTTSQSPDAQGKTVTRQQILDLLANAYRQTKELDPTRLVHASDGGTPHAFTDVLSSGSAKGSAKPFLLHEYGTYCCSLPDFALIPRLDGVIRPLTYERAERYVADHNLGAAYPVLWRSSLQMRADAQKHYIESAKASGSNCGYSFWLGVDFPDSPEGCWDEGILNQLWEPKPFLTNGLAAINSPTVLLTTSGLGARSFYTDQEKVVGIRLWHYGPDPIRNGRLSWRLRDGEHPLARGEVESIQCEPGTMVNVAQIKMRSGTNAPSVVTLEVDLQVQDRALTRNSWPFYAYPRVAVSEVMPGVYSEFGSVFGATELRADQELPKDLRVLITRSLKKGRHEALFRSGTGAVLLLGTGGFKEARAGYFLNQYGTGFGGIIEEHPMFDGIPHDGRLNLGLYQLVAGGGLLETESMPTALRDGTVVWGLRLTGWISPIKNLRKVAHVCEVLADNRLHLLLCNLDLTTDRPECRYVLQKTIEYLRSGQRSSTLRPCAAADLETLLR